MLKLCLLLAAQMGAFGHITQTEAIIGCVITHENQVFELDLEQVELAHNQIKRHKDGNYDLYKVLSIGYTKAKPVAQVIRLATKTGV